jgi:hypothetical protein
MPTYAMIVVVEADNPVMAHDTVADTAMRPAGACQFVGDPWEVAPSNQYPDHEPEGGPRGPIYEREFDTLSCIDQHPDREPAR